MTPQQRAIEALRKTIEFLKDAPLSSGVCCCGDNMDGHPSPLNCGHSPTDSGQYAVTGLIDDLSTAIAAVDAEKPAYTEGHCAERKKPGGCQLHNLQCGYPQCDRRLVQPVDAPKVYPAAQPAEPVQEPVAWGQLGLLNGKTYLRMNYDRTPYPPPADIVHNLNLVPLYTAPPAPQRQPFTPAQRRRLYDNSPEARGDATGFAAFERLVQLVERAHSIGDK